MAHLSWQAPEYPHTKKSQDWYWVVGIIAAALVATVAIFGNFLFAIVLAIGAFSLTLIASRAPRVVTMTLSDKGVSVGQTLYPFSALESFGVVDAATGPRLHLKQKKSLLPPAVIMVAHEVRDEVIEGMLLHLPQEEIELGFFEALLERLGF